MAAAAGNQDAGTVDDTAAEGHALRVLGVITGSTLYQAADALFSGIYPDRTLYSLEWGNGGELYALLEYDWVMQILDQRRMMIQHAGSHHRLAFVRVPRTDIRGRRGACIFRRMN
jgi:hypothetical protein